MKLYLDDVREIVDILSMKDSDSTTRDYSVKYRVRDLECDTLEELEKIGGSATKFQVIVMNNRRRSTLRLGLWTYLELQCPENDYWQKHGKIRKILEDNSIWWRNIAREVVNRIPFWFFILFIVATYAIGGPATFFKWQGMALGILAGYVLFGRGSVIVLRYSHTGGARKWIQDHSTQIAFVILAAILGAIAKEYIRPFINLISGLWH